MYYPIDERAAKTAHDMNSMFDYQPNRTTNAYQAEVNEAAAIARQEIEKRPEQADEIRAYLQDRSDFTGYSGQNWNRRYRDYMEKIKTGSVQEVAVVLRDLFLLSVDKDLSYGERKMLDTAKNLLVKELSLAQNTEESAVSKSIEAIFS